MSFYLKPPRGQINFHQLEECARQRLLCYDKISNNDTLLEISSFECLVEDSSLDRTGHFIFRLSAYFSSRFRDVFLRNEAKLLLLRLNCYKEADLKYFLKKILRQIKDILEENEADNKILEVCIWFFKICHQMLKKEYLAYIFNGSHKADINNNYILKVPFHVCPSLIRNREVNLNKSFVIIPVEDWKNLFLSIYDSYLKLALDAMKYSRNVENTLYDDRIIDILKFIKSHYFKNISNTNTDSKFDIKNMEEESKFFPLCMLNLYKVLQMTNRLSHNDRFDFSLFIKGIGISLNDSLKFWEDAYSKQHASCSRCTHDWQKNEKRYIYGIRHLYGLEGSRKNYEPKSCQYLQEKTLCATEDGGCPFKNFDDNSLRRALKKLLPNKDDEVEVMIYERKESPGESCKLFYNIILENFGNESVDRVVNFQNPVEYYVSLKNTALSSNSSNTNSNGA